MVGTDAGRTPMSEGLVEEFGRRWESLGGFYARIHRDDPWRPTVLEAWNVLVGDGAGSSPTVVDGADDRWGPIDWSTILSADVVRWDGSEAMRAACERAVLGITGCAWAVAATGSVALYSTAATGLLPSVLPPAHLVLLRAEDVVATVADGLNRVPRPAMPALMKLVTGPSMTADIEGTLVTGVHGPGRVGVIVRG